MLERVLTPDNILDRVAALERRLAELESGAVTVQVVQVPDSGAGSALNGWLATGSAFMDLLGRVVLDASLPGIRLDSGGIIYSADYQAGVSGFKIDGGTAEFNNIAVRGTVYATTGAIGGWTISSGHLYAGSGSTRVGLRPADYPFYAGADNPASAPFRVTAAGKVTASSGLIAGWTLAASELYAGSGASRVGLRPGTYPLYAGADDPASAPFRVTAAGAVTASNANITGTVDANAGHIGSLDVDGVLTVGAAAPYIQVDGINKRIRTSTFATGLQGFSLEGDGSAEFANVSVRGEIHAAVLAYGEQLATSGTLIVAKAAGKLRADVTTVASPTTFNVEVEDPDTGHVQLFAVGDVLRLQDATRTNWVTVQSISDQTTFYRYVCVLSNGTAGTFRAGAVAMDYGQSGQGVLLLTADQTNAPFYSVRTHAGSPWSAETEVARLGNLVGNWGYSSTTYGIALGRYAASKANLTWDPTNGLRLRTYTTTVLQLDNAGGASIQGVLNIGAAGGIYQGTGTFGAPQTGLKIWNDGGVGRLATCNSGILQVYLGTDGKFYAGGGAVYLDANGLTIDTLSMITDPTMIKFKYLNVLRGIIVAYNVDIGGGSLHGYHVRMCDSNYKGVDIYGGDIFLGNAVVPSKTHVAGGLSVGWESYNQSTLPPTVANMDAYIRNDIRAGGGLAVGSTSVDPAAGNIYATGYIYGTNPLGCRVIRTTTQSIPNATLTALSFDTEIYDTGSCWSSAYPDRLYAPVGGYYMAGGGWERNPTNNPTASRHWVAVGHFKSSGTLIAHYSSNEIHTIAGKYATASTTTGMFYMNAGEYIQVLAHHDSGAARNASAASTQYQRICYGWLARMA